MKAVLIGLILCISLFGNAQTTVENVLDMKTAKQSGAIYEDEKLIGYYTFFFKEKSDKKNSIYEIGVYDDNFTLKKSFEVKRAKNTMLINTLFNGTTFLFSFYDYTEGYEAVTFDKSGKQLGTFKMTVKDMKKSKMAIGSISFYTLNSKGFLQTISKKNKKYGFQVLAIDNTMKKTWEMSSNVTSPLNEYAIVNSIGDKYITLNTGTYKKAMSAKNRTSNYIALNIETGKKEFDYKFNLEKEEANKIYLKNVFNEKDKSLTFVGEYFKPGANMFGVKSLGIFVQKIDQTGKQSFYKEYKWKGDLDKFKMAKVDEEDKKDAEKPFYTFFHEVVFGENGHMYLIGEQFKKQVSASAIAGKVAMTLLSAATGVSASSNASNFEIRLANMVVIELDETAKLVDFEMINKKKRSVALPDGAGINSAYNLGLYVNAMGEFDYEFTSKNKDKDQYNVVYIDSDRKEEDSKAKADLMVGIINIQGGVITTKRTAINSDAKYIWMSPAKPGYVTITEYYKKEKKVVFHLEPLTY